MVHERIQSVIYIIFITLAFLTILPAVLYFLEYRIFFKVYMVIYVSCIGIYTWYRFINLAYYDLGPKMYGVNFYTPFTVVVPCYNEDPVLLERCIESVENAKGDKKIIIIDDGSTNGI